MSLETPETPETPKTPKTPGEQWEDISNDAETAAEDIHWGGQQFDVMLGNSSSRSEVWTKLAQALDLYSVNPERQRALEKVQAALQSLEDSEGSENLLQIEPIIADKAEQYLKLPA